MSVSVVGAKLWNELDSNLRNTKTILLFKNKSNGVYFPRMYHISPDAKQFNCAFCDTSMKFGTHLV